ncbi:MAG: hypothetical protein LBQ33_01050 [Oscillospiraceae bacterium]|jgi:putative aldouronate transport system substrate-binding protein|nr:hypothetical protein [Oscillospiraceae bacterium]
MKRNAKAKANRQKGKSKAKLIKLLAILLVACIAVGTGLFFLFTRRGVLKVAARSDLIKHWEEQGITKHFEDTLELRIQWIDYGGAEVYLKLQEDLGKDARQLPDAYLGLGLESDQLAALLAQDAFLELSDSFVKEYAPNLQQIIDADVSRKAEMLLNGKLYSLPSLNAQYAEEYPQKAWINHEWLVRTRQEMPDTPQELLEVLRKFKEADPNGNGLPDEVPLGAAYGASAAGATFGYLIHAFVTTDYDLTPTNYLNLSDEGKVYAGVTMPGYKDALAYLHSLYAEGLVDQAVFSQGSEVFLNASKAQEKYGVILAKDVNALFNDPDRASGYVPLAPLKNGDQCAALVKRTPIKTGGFLIPGRIDSERQILALRFGDAMLSAEGTLTVCYGEENVGWFRADDSSTAMGGERATWRLGEDAQDGTAFYSALSGEVPYWLSSQRQMERQAVLSGSSKVSLQTKENWQGYLNQVTKDYYEPVGRANIKNALPALVPEGEAAQALTAGGKNVYADVIDFLTQRSQDFVTGKAELSAQWDAFVAELNQKGLAQIVAAVQAAKDLEQ